jgi:dTMP kinase
MKFFVFEGLDGAGKSTLIQKVQTYLQTQSLKVELVRDPGSTDLGEKLRRLVLDPEWSPASRTEVLLYQAARAQLVSEKIRPYLAQKTWVLSDRFYSSTIAFQCYARGLNRADIDWLNRYACEGLQPNLVIFIDIPVSESARRIQKRTSESGTEQDRMEQENSTFHEKVRQGYLAQAKEDPEHWLVLDGFLTPDQLFEEVLKHLRGKKWLA